MFNVLKNGQSGSRLNNHGVRFQKFENVESRVLEIRGHKVILDCDLADLNGVETRDIKKAVKNNPDKFPAGYLFELSKDELDDLRWKFSTAKFSKTRVMPKAFTEKGRYGTEAWLPCHEAAY